MKIGLFMGSFNPIHIGHMAIANYMLEFTDIDEIKFIVSPRNPHKEDLSLLDGNIRTKMVDIAINNTKNMHNDDIEFGMTRPSYTANTLKQLISENSRDEFILIIGSDNLQILNKWKDYQYILDNFKIYVFERLGYTNINKQFLDNKNIKILSQCPTVSISSTFIRDSIRNNQDIKFFLPCGIDKYIKDNDLYN